MARSALDSKDSFKLLFCDGKPVTILVAASWMNLCLKMLSSDSAEAN